MAFTPTNATPTAGRGTAYHSQGAAGTKQKAVIQDLGGAETAAETAQGPWVALPDTLNAVDIAVVATALTGAGCTLIVNLQTCTSPAAVTALTEVPAVCGSTGTLSAALGQTGQMCGVAKKYIRISETVGVGTAATFTAIGYAVPLGIRA
jgi:hypothetical protein